MITKESKLCDIILRDSTIIPVINRFNIMLGVGDKTINMICEEKHLDADFFTTILNTYMHEGYFPDTRLKSFCANTIVEYLTKTNTYYEQFQLPNIERHFNLLINKTDNENNNLELMFKFFNELKRDLELRIKNDAKVWFPQIKELSKNYDDNSNNKVVAPEEIESDPIEEKLADLKSLFIMHLTGEFDFNLCYAVIFAICSLEKDIKKNNRIRNRILKPLFIAMGGKL